MSAVLPPAIKPAEKASYAQLLAFDLSLHAPDEWRESDLNAKHDWHHRKFWTSHLPSVANENQLFLDMVLKEFKSSVATA